MFRSFTLTSTLIASGLLSVLPSIGFAQTQVLSTSAPVVEYQYQLYYPRYWGYGYAWAGPGLSLGGSLPEKGREGISSFYGRPLPVPLGAGVYVNPFSYATQLPGPPVSFGLASSAAGSSGGMASPTMQMTGGAPGTMPTGGMNASPISATPISRTTAVPPASNTTAPSAAALAPTTPSRSDDIRPIAYVSSNASLKRSREIELFGDDKLQTQQWMQAYINYRNAVDAAPDRAEAHVRLGFAALAMNRYAESVTEFKRALLLDPLTGKTGETLSSVFGPDSQDVRAVILRDVPRWTRENLRDQDRLFLLGFVLHYNEDTRSREILDAALRLPGSKDHLVALRKPAPPRVHVAPAEPPAESMDEFPAPVPEPPELPPIPELHQQPLALHLVK